MLHTNHQHYYQIHTTFPIITVITPYITTVYFAFSIKTIVKTTRKKGISLALILIITEVTHLIKMVDIERVGFSQRSKYYFAYILLFYCYCLLFVALFYWIYKCLRCLLYK